MYKITNQSPAQEFSINPSTIQWDMQELKKGTFHIIQNNISYTATVVEADYANKTFRIDVNGQIYNLELKDEMDLLADQMGLSNTAAKKANNIKAPMPGMVLSVLVKEGQSVKKGDAILILVAMKMENVIKASADAIIQKINVQKDTAVEKGQVLVELG